MDCHLTSVGRPRLSSVKKVSFFLSHSNLPPMQQVSQQGAEGSRGRVGARRVSNLAMRHWSRMVGASVTFAEVGTVGALVVGPARCSCNLEKPDGLAKEKRVACAAIAGDPPGEVADAQRRPAWRRWPQLHLTFGTARLAEVAELQTSLHCQRNLIEQMLKTTSARLFQLNWIALARRRAQHPRWVQAERWGFRALPWPAWQWQPCRAPSWASGQTVWRCRYTIQGLRSAAVRVTRWASACPVEECQSAKEPCPWVWAD